MSNPGLIDTVRFMTGQVKWLSGSKVQLFYLNLNDIGSWTYRIELWAAPFGFLGSGVAENRGGVM